MISDNIAGMLNMQMNLEFSAWYKYTAMSAACDTISWKGCASWFALQADEERGHAMKIYRYLLDQGRCPEFLPLPQPTNDYSNLVDLFKAALQSEQMVTRSLNELAGASAKENDYATHIFLHWFVTEQVEEEASVRDILDRLRLIDGNIQGLLLLDQELGSRVNSVGEGEK